ncbi:MAG: thiol protease/hemagglutinin PrtT [Bacteroidetes bacterium]|nr:thiol protease/hemagglutinin PrtT [Bacteroidota bacterium]
MIRSIFLLLVVTGMLLGGSTQAQYADENLCRSIAGKFLERLNSEGSLTFETDIVSEGLILARIYTIEGGGFMIVSADRSLRPVYAYSFTGWFDMKEEGWEIQIPLITIDLQNRLQASEKVRNINRNEWTRLLNNIPQENLTREQWPPAGTTPTGGWLEENWSQGSPYKNMCPMDLNTGNRSIAGCPAVAMAQILNYHKRINQTRFDDADDYYHSFGSNNQYWIDDDFASRDFPPFPMLNEHLDSLEANYEGGRPINNDQKAALNFACGIAAHQVYSSSISGTYGIEQAMDAYMRFTFDSARLVYPDDSTLNRQLADNIKEAMPAHLGLLSEQSGGHNLVVDGYNTDEYYHFNFGWGGSNNGWYTMPPTNIAYNLTIIEGVILDINIENMHVGINDLSSDWNDNFRVYPNPASDFIFVESIQEGMKLKSIRLFGSSGSLIFSQTGSEIKNARIDLRTCTPGIYFLQCITGKGNIESKKLIILE